MNSSNFKHYVITRFNVPYPQAMEGDTPKGIKPDYLKQRFEVFDRYTVPSLQNQTCKDFVWVVLFDKRTPEPFMGKILKYKDDGVFRPVFVEKLDYANKTVRELVEEEDIDNLPVITSRVDNDDAIVNTYVESIQLAAKEILPKERYLSSPYVFRFDTKEKTLTKYKMRKNHFVSRTGMLDDVGANVYHLSQDEMPKDARYYDIVPGIHSIEIVHESNLLNNTKYKFKGILSKEEYKTAKETCEFDALEYSKNRSVSIRKSFASLPKNVKKTIASDFRAVKRIITKGDKK